jgi:hypothetical protein
LIGAAVLAAPVLRDEWTAAHLEAATGQDLGQPPPMAWNDTGPTPACSSGCPARADAALGVHFAVSAAREADADLRAGMLAQAQAHLLAALEVRPTSAGWWAWLAYARLLDGRDDRKVVEALAQSYDAAPFLAREGPWRVEYGATNWGGLTPALRGHVIDEAVWMRDVDPDNASAVFAAFTDPSAAAALRAGLAKGPALLVPHRRGGGPGRVGAVS